MDITISEEKGRVLVTVFQVAGRINLGNADELIRRAQKAYQEGTRNLVLDLSGVDSLTSAGLRAILTIMKLLETETTDSSSPRGKSQHVKLISPTEYVLITIKTAGFDRYLEIHENLSEAVASF
jgi:anti-anti-sigma factor